MKSDISTRLLSVGHRGHTLCHWDRFQFYGQTRASCAATALNGCLLHLGLMTPTNPPTAKLNMQCEIHYEVDVFTNSLLKIDENTSFPIPLLFVLSFPGTSEIAFGESWNVFASIGWYCRDFTSAKPQKHRTNEAAAEPPT